MKSMKTVDESKESNVLFVSYVRVLAMFFVILVHLCQQSGFTPMRAMAQFFITGVTIFVLLTGYLYGLKARNINYPGSIVSWLKNRGKRILIPYYITVLFVLLMDRIVYNQKITLKHILMFFSCTQDFFGQFFYQIYGTGHLWYITMLILSYASIAIVLKCRKSHKNMIYGVVISLYILQLSVTLFVQPKIGRYLFYIVICLSAYLYGNNRSKNQIHIRTRWIVLTIVTMVVWIIRSYLWLKGCNTEIYNNLYTYYSQGILSVWFIYTFCYLEQLRILKEVAVLKKINGISYEVFLVHFIFIDGPIKIIGCFNNLLLESVIIILLSLIAGNILALVSNLLTNRGNK